MWNRLKLERTRAWSVETTQSRCRLGREEGQGPADGRPYPIEAPREPRPSPFEAPHFRSGVLAITAAITERWVQQMHEFDVPNRPGSVEASDAFHNLDVLYADQGKPIEAEKMYRRALDGKRESMRS